MPATSCDMAGIQADGVTVPIPNELRDIPLGFECPKCGHPIIRKGSWFKVISRFNCNHCGAALRLGYPEKLALFEKHKHLAGQRPRGAGL